MPAVYSPPRAPKSVRVKRDAANSAAYYLTLAPAEAEATGAAWRFPGLTRWCALHRRGLFWSEPKWGADPAAIPPQTQCLIWSAAGGGRHVLLPLYAGEHRATFEPTPEGAALRLAAGMASSEGEGEGAGGAAKPVVAAVYACGPDTATALRRAFLAAREALGTFRLREEKARPEFLDYLGWCTWDAFYHQLSAAKVRRGLDSFGRGGVTPGFMMLDDGWLDVTGDHLNGFAADAKKFPGGLAPVIRDARRRGVRKFGVWHALQGYWAGVAPDGPLARDYRLDARPGNIRPWNPDETRELARVEEADIARFYQDFHRHLRAQGVDWVKVDGQGALERFTAGRTGRVGATRRWQEALQGAAAAHFGGGLLHCMSNANDIALHLGAGNAWRNSDDYFPRRGTDQQRRHLVFNAYNALWSANFAWPDWDMFQSHGPEAAAHAAARALSGGPIYVSDHPGRQDFALLRRVALADGRVPAWDRPALPTEDIVLRDPLSEAVALKLHNRRGPLGVLGLFYCRTVETAGPLVASWRADDVPGSPAGEPMVEWSPVDETHRLLAPRERRRETLGPGEFRVRVFAPIGAARATCLGLRGLWNGAAALGTLANETPGRMAARLRLPGSAVFWSEEAPRHVTVDGRPAPVRRIDERLWSVAVRGNEGGEVIASF